MCKDMGYVKHENTFAHGMNDKPVLESAITADFDLERLVCLVLIRDFDCSNSFGFPVPSAGHHL